MTLKLMVEDPRGYFVPNIRRDNFAVYEDGVRQKNVTVEIEHAPVTVALLLEFGGRYHELNNVLAQEVPQAAHQLLDVIGRDDKVAAFKYDSKLQTIADFSQGHEVLEGAFDHLEIPGFSEANFYDALQEALNRMRSISGRKAVIVISRWREKVSYMEPDNPDYQKKTVEMVNSFDDQAPGVHPHDEHDVDKLDHMTVKRMVYPKKGKWRRFSQDVIDEIMKDEK